MTAGHAPDPSVCFVGLANLPVLAREYAHHGIGGMQVQQTLLARALTRRGWEVSMVVTHHGQPDGATWDGIKTWRAYAPKAGIPIFRFIHPRWTSVWSALKRADADIYYVSGCSFLVGLVAMFARRYGRGLVYRVASISDCDPRTLRVKFWRDRQLYSYGLRRADTVLAQTAEQQKILLASYARSSIVVEPLQDPPGRCDRFDAREIDVLWIGAIRPLKRPHLLLELARRLPDVSFAIAGGPSSDNPALYEETRQQAGQLPNVRFLGSVPYHDVRALYESARVFVSTSEIEGFPNTWLQAWAHGAPVVAMLDPGNLLSEHRLGSLVGSVDDMAAAVFRLLNDPAEWAAASARCLQYSSSRSDEGAKMQPYLDALRSLGASVQARAPENFGAGSRIAR
jgi:glycosyltransferase involved in cell wall biosynthesis